MAGWIRQHFDVPVLVDNDVNIMALGEQSHAWPGIEQAQVPCRTDRAMMGVQSPTEARAREKTHGRVVVGRPGADGTAVAAARAVGPGGAGHACAAVSRRCTMVSWHEAHALRHQSRNMPR